MINKDELLYKLNTVIEYLKNNNGYNYKLYNQLCPDYEASDSNIVEYAEDVKFYLDFFKHGCPPHGGFAIGVDRLTMLLLGIPSVKESQFLFRGPNRLNP